MAEAFSGIGVPVFAADVKGDLSGISQAGKSSPKFDDRVKTLGLGEVVFAACPVVFWDVFGKQGHPVRATVSEMGAAAAEQDLESERYAVGCADAGVQNCGR